MPFASRSGVRECRQVREVRFIDGQVTNADHPPALKMDTGCVCYTRKGSGCCIDHKCRLGCGLYISINVVVCVVLLHVACAVLLVELKLPGLLDGPSIDVLAVDCR